MPTTLLPAVRCCIRIAVLAVATYTSLHAQWHVWEPAGGPDVGLPGLLCTHPSDGSSAAAPISGGVFFREGTGDWKLQVTGLTDLNVTALTPAGSGVWYAGTQDSGVFRYSAATKEWTKAGDELPEGRVNALFATRAGTVLALVRQSWMQALAAGDTRWKTTGAGFPPDPYPMEFRAQFMQDITGRLWAATSMGVYTSSNDGMQWTPRNDGLAHTNAPCGIARATGGLLFVGLTFGGAHVSTNNGASWSRIDTTDGPKHIRAIAADDSGTVLITSDEGVFYSDDGGVVFRRLRTGVRGETFKALAVAGRGDFVGFSDLEGIWTGGTAGPWTRANDGLHGTRISALSMRGDGTLLAGSNNGWVFSSVNNGRSWSRLEAVSNVTSAYIHDLLVTHTGTLLVATAYGILRGTNSWTSFSFVQDVLAPSGFFQARDGRIFSGISGYTLVSTDDGVTWTTTDTLLSTEYPAAFVQRADGAILAGIDGEIHGNSVRILEAGAATWRNFGTGLDTTDVTALCSAGASIFAGTRRHGVFEYNASGDIWLPVNDGLNTLQITHLIAGYNNDVYAAVWGDAVYHHTPGSGWTARNDGLVNRRVIELALGLPDNPRLFAGTQGSSVYTTSIPGPAATDHIPSPASLHIDLPAPHPVSGDALLRFTASTGKHTSLTVWNALGRRIAVLHEGIMHTDERTIRWDTSQLAAGPYLLRLEQDGRTADRVCIVAAAP